MHCYKGNLVYLIDCMLQESPLSQMNIHSSQETTANANIRFIRSKFSARGFQKTFNATNLVHSPFDFDNNNSNNSNNNNSNNNNNKTNNNMGSEMDTSTSNHPSSDTMNLEPPALRTPANKGLLNPRSLHSLISFL